MRALIDSIYPYIVKIGKDVYGRSSLNPRYLEDASLSCATNNVKFLKGMGFDVKIKKFTRYNGEECYFVYSRPTGVK